GWMLIIAAASTDMMSAQHTSRFIGPLLRWLAPDISPATIAGVQLFIRKCAHLTEYAILGILLARAFFRGEGKATARYAVLIWLTALVWAGLDEFHQSFVASRTGSPIDVMIDATGALVGLGIYWLCTSRARLAARAMT
ncbi:MAG: VanZ family protein, partial [Chthoniobacterales bacterium]